MIANLQISNAFINQSEKPQFFDLCKEPTTESLFLMLFNAEDVYQNFLIKDFQKTHQSDSENSIEKRFSLRMPSKNESPFCHEKIIMEEKTNQFPRFEEKMECTRTSFLKDRLTNFQCVVEHEYNPILIRQGCDSNGTYIYKDSLSQHPLFCVMKRI